MEGTDNGIEAGASAPAAQQQSEQVEVVSFQLSELMKKKEP